MSGNVDSIVNKIKSKKKPVVEEPKPKTEEETSEEDEEYFEDDEDLGEEEDENSEEDSPENPEEEDTQEEVPKEETPKEKVRQADPVFIQDKEVIALRDDGLFRKALLGEIIKVNRSLMVLNSLLNKAINEDGEGNEGKQE